jgi:purine-binding chemotaxis protein CheW
MNAHTQSTAVAAPGRFLGFRLGDQTYGLDIGVVQEISGMLAVTRVPGAPAHVRGVVNLHGRVVPVVDLRVRLGMAVVPDTRRTCLVVCRIGDGAGSVIVAAAVDEVTEVLNIAAEASAPPAAGRYGSYVAGLARSGDGVVVLLDAVRSLGDDDGAGGAA